MKMSIILLCALFCAAATEAATNQVPTLTISAQDVVQGSIHKYPSGPHLFTIKFEYTESGSNRARAFTAAHHHQMVCEKVGAFETPPGLLGPPVAIGRHSYYGVSEEQANAIIDGLKKR
jgi:hypothetical protein